jgi:transposase-like protein
MIQMHHFVLFFTKGCWFDGLHLKRLAIRLGLKHHRRMNAYSEDLRKKIVQAKERGMPTAAVARTFGVGISSVKRYAKTAREGGSLRPKKSPGRDPRRPASARGGSWRQTSGIDRPPPSPRGANTCAAWPG